MRDVLNRWRRALVAGACVLSASGATPSAFERPGTVGSDKDLRPQSVRAPAAATEREAATVTHFSTAAVLRRQRALQEDRQRAMDTIAGFIEGAGPLRLAGERDISRVGVHHEASRHPRGRCKMHQVQAVERCEADVRHDPVIGSGEHVRSSDGKCRIVIDVAESSRRASQPRAQGAVGIDEQDPGGHHGPARGEQRGRSPVNGKHGEPSLHINPTAFCCSRVHLTGRCPAAQQGTGRAPPRPRGGA